MSIDILTILKGQKERRQLKEALADPSYVKYKRIIDLIISEVMSEKMPEIMSAISDKISELKKSVKDGQDGESIKGDQGLQGEKGDTIIGPKGDKGDKPIAGVDFILPKDGKDADEDFIIKEVVSKIPKPKDGKDGMAGKDGSPDTGEQIAEKLNKLKEVVDQTVIRGLPALIKGLQRAIQDKKANKGGGMGNWVTEAPTGAINGANTTFTITSRVASSGNAIILLYQGQVLEKGNQFTISGKTITTLFIPETNTFLFAMYVRT